MQSPTPDLMPAHLKNTLTTRLQGLLTDPDLSVEIVYRRPRQSTYSPTTGLQARHVSEWTFDAVAADVSVKLVNRSGGRLKIGDRRFVFMRSELLLEPTSGDEIKEGSNVFKVVSWKSDPQAMTWVVTGRKT